MFIASADEIRSGISRLIEESSEDDPILLAVAFWGNKVETILPRGRRYKIICNLSTGGTNPATIRNLMKYPCTEVKNEPALHAKVMIGQRSCLLGSANFSNNALGFQDIATWLEANVILSNTDERYLHIQQWFLDRWTDAELVNEATLRDAERKWTLRTKFVAECHDISKIKPDISTSRYTLDEGDLFKPVISGENKIRMASTFIESLFRQIEQNIDKTMVRIPAFVSAILWTYSGRTIGTNIRHRPYFQIPAHVWERALEPGQPKYNEEKIHKFLSFLSNNTETPLAIRFWATQYLDSGSPGAP